MSSAGATARATDWHGMAGVTAGGQHALGAGEARRGVVLSLEYSDVSRRSRAAGLTESAELVRVAGPTEAEIEARVAAACAREREQTEERLRAEWAGRERTMQAEVEEAAQTRVAGALRRFAEERTGYFGCVEREVVGLALAIARKILAREAEVDPLLTAGLVRLALDGMERGAAVRLRVAGGQVEAWERRVAGMGLRTEVVVAGDAGVAEGECVVEMESGSARLSSERQMKELERGFEDLLRQRPDIAGGAA